MEQRPAVLDLTFGLFARSEITADEYERHDADNARQAAANQDGEHADVRAGLGGLLALGQQLDLGPAHLRNTQPNPIHQLVPFTEHTHIPGDPDFSLKSSPGVNRLFAGARLSTGWFRAYVEAQRGAGVNSYSVALAFKVP